MNTRLPWISAVFALLVGASAWGQTAAPSARAPRPATSVLWVGPPPQEPNSWVKALVPDQVQGTMLWNMPLWQWLGIAVGLVLGWILATLIASATVSALDKLAQRTVTTWDDMLLRTARRPVRLLLWVVFFQLVCTQLDLQQSADRSIGHLAYTGYVIGGTWLLLGIVNTGTVFYEGGPWRTTRWGS